MRGTLSQFLQRTTPDPSYAAAVNDSHPDRPNPAEPEVRIRKTVIVERGETISSLAQKYYGVGSHAVMDQILTVNPEITNLHLVREGQTLKLPEIKEDSRLVQIGEGTYKIWLGTFPNFDNAATLKKDPSLRGLHVEILPRPVSPRETWYRAVIGGFATREACLTAIQGLRVKEFLPPLEEQRFGKYVELDRRRPIGGKHGEDD
jgi:phage tail protein X